MSFLRSVITDARPHKPMPEPSNNPSVIPGGKTRRMDSDAFGTEEKSPNAPDQTSHLNISLPIRDSVSEFTVGDTPTFQANNPVSQDIQNIGCNIKPENPFSVPEENTQNRASGHDEAEPASSPASIRDMPGK